VKLYFSPAACSLAPHIILREAGVPFSLERVDTKAKTTETGADFLAINPKGYVPVLQLDDGEIVTEGIVLQQLIADEKPQANLAPPRGTKERRKLEQWLVFLATEVHKAHLPLFWPATPDNAKPVFVDKIGQRYDLIEKTLSDGRDYLTGETFTIADAYLFTLANWAQRAGIDLAKWPHLQSYVGRVAARPAVQAALEAEGLKKPA
jgi:glutathione S-transferase